MGWEGPWTGTGTGEIKSEDRESCQESSGQSIPILLGGLLPSVCPGFAGVNVSIRHDIVLSRVWSGP